MMSVALFPYAIFTDKSNYLWVLVPGGRRELTVGSSVILLESPDDEQGIEDLEVTKLYRTTIEEAIAEDPLKEYGLHVGDLLGCADAESAFYMLEGYYKTRYARTSNFTIVQMKYVEDQPVDNTPMSKRVK
jgi:hypothetical protein